MKITTVISQSVFLMLLIGFGVSAHAATTTASTTEPSFQNQVEVEKRVREYFADLPVMIEIARCESKFRQFADSGAVLRGGVDNGMLGVFQFHERVHAGAASVQGHSLKTLEGNLGYARHLYNTHGTMPWNSSRYCWEHAVTASSTPAIPPTRAELTAKIEKLLELIKLLKQLQELRALQV